LLRSIDIDISDIKTGLGNLAPVVNDTAHHMNAVANTVPVISKQVTEIHTAVAQLASNSEPQILPSRPNEYYLVPSRRIPDFVGREDVLTRIETGFSLGTTPRIVVVRGLGGQGKTQIALRYCYQAQSNGIRAIFWVDATSENSMIKSFTSISNSIKHPRQVLHDSPESRARFVLEKLRTWPEPWLIVFDNHDDPSAFNIRDFIPQAREHGFVLVTSRHADTDDLTESENAIELQGLPENDALSLLFKQSRAATSESTLQHGRIIVERLGYHALAIRQAGSYISLRKIELHQFMDRYNQQRSRVQILNQTPQMSEYRRKLDGAFVDAKETVLSVFTTWELTFRQLQAMDTAERHREHKMTLFAFYDSKEISEELFQATCKEGAATTEYTRAYLGSCMDVSGHWVHENFVGTLIDLTQLSLVQSWSQDESDVCHLTLHPLIKDWIRLRTDIVTCRNHSILAARMLANLLWNSMDSSKYFQLSLSSSQTILLHLDTYYENLAVIGMDTNPRTLPSEYGDFENSEYWFHAFLSENGQKSKAAEIGRRLATWHERRFGPDHNNTIISLHNLARSLADVGKHTEAEEIHRRVLKFRERSLGPEHPDTLSSSHELAHVLQEQGKYKDAGEIVSWESRDSPSACQGSYFSSSKISFRHQL
jgi:RecA/RadA recombinase